MRHSKAKQSTAGYTNTGMKTDCPICKKDTTAHAIVCDQCLEHYCGWDCFGDHLCAIKFVSDHAIFKNEQKKEEKKYE